MLSGESEDVHRICSYFVAFARWVGYKQDHSKFWDYPKHAGFPAGERAGASAVRSGRR